VVLATTNYAAVVRPLQVLVMVIAVLFFVRVLRVAQVESRPVEDVGPRERRSRRRSSNLSLEFIEPLEREKERVSIDRAVIVGRSPECDVSVNDTYISSRHARFSMDEGELSVEDLESTNGTYVNQELVKGRIQLERGDIVQVGGVLFEVVR